MYIESSLGYLEMGLFEQKWCVKQRRGKANINAEVDYSYSRSTTHNFRQILLAPSWLELDPFFAGFLAKAGNRSVTNGRQPDKSSTLI